MCAAMTERRRHENEGNRGMEAWRDKRVAGWMHVEVAVIRESVRRRNLLAQVNQCNECYVEQDQLSPHVCALVVLLEAFCASNSVIVQ